MIDGSSVLSCGSNRYFFLQAISAAKLFNSGGLFQSFSHKIMKLVIIDEEFCEYL